MSSEQRIINLVQIDAIRMRALHAVSSLNLPDWLIAAGFIRNLVWGHIYRKEVALNDIDVIYFCKTDLSRERDKDLERRLFELEPGLLWSVKNQARMHLKHGDPPYENTLEAMSFWPEKQTCVGAMLNESGALIIRHCFDLNLQFNGEINLNPKRSLTTFQNRIFEKKWLRIWPQLQVII